METRLTCARAQRSSIVSVLARFGFVSRTDGRAPAVDRGVKSGLRSASLGRRHARGSLRRSAPRGALAACTAWPAGHSWSTRTGVRGLLGGA